MKIYDLFNQLKFILYLDARFFQIIDISYSLQANIFQGKMILKFFIPTKTLHRKIGKVTERMGIDKLEVKGRVGGGQTVVVVFKSLPTVRVCVCLSVHPFLSVCLICLYLLSPLHLHCCSCCICLCVNHTKSQKNIKKKSGAYLILPNILISLALLNQKN